MTATFLAGSGFLTTIGVRSAYCLGTLPGNARRNTGPSRNYPATLLSKVKIPVFWDPNLEEVRPQFAFHVSCFGITSRRPAPPLSARFVRLLPLCSTLLPLLPPRSLLLA